MRDTKIILLKKRSHNLESGISKPLFGSIVVLSIFVIWSFFAFFSALLKPYNNQNPLLSLTRSSGNLAISMLIEIAGNYFSPFAILNILIIILMLLFYSQLKKRFASLLVFPNSDPQLNSPRPSSFFSYSSSIIENGTDSNSLIIRQQKPNNPSEVILDIAPKVAICLEKTNVQERELIINLENYNQLIRTNHFSQVDDVIPLSDCSIKIEIVEDDKKSRDHSCIMQLTYGFPIIDKGEKQGVINPEIIQVINNIGQYQTWRLLILEGIKAGVCASNYEIIHFSHNLMKIRKSNDPSEKNIPLKTVAIPPIKHHQVYHHNINRRLFKLSTFHRNRKHTHLSVFLSTKKNKTDKKEINRNGKARTFQDLEINISTKIKQVFSVIYQQPVVKIKINKP